MYTVENKPTRASGWEGLQRREIDGVLVRPPVSGHWIHRRQCQTGGVGLAAKGMVPIAAFQSRNPIALLYYLQTVALTSPTHLSQAGLETLRGFFSQSTTNPK